jgi:hypothetical protein
MKKIHFEGYVICHCARIDNQSEAVRSSPGQLVLNK